MPSYSTWKRPAGRLNDSANRPYRSLRLNATSCTKRLPYSNESGMTRNCPTVSASVTWDYSFKMSPCSNNRPTSGYLFVSKAARLIPYVPLPRPFAQARTTLPETIALMDRLLDEGTDAQVAQRLNQQGGTTLEGFPFPPAHVPAPRHAYHLKSRFTRLREVGWQTADEVAARFAVTPKTVWRCYHQGLIQAA